MTPKAARDARDERLQIAAGILILLLLAAALLLPFWMEYKSLSSPPLPRREAGSGPVLDNRTEYYCPNCSEKLSLPRWSTEAPRGRSGPLTLSDLAGNPVAVSTNAPRVRLAAP